MQTGNSIKEDSLCLGDLMLFWSTADQTAAFAIFWINLKWGSIWQEQSDISAMSPTLARTEWQDIMSFKGMQNAEWLTNRTNQSCHKYIIRHTVVQLLHTFTSQLSGHPSFGVVGTLMETTQEGHGAIDCHKTPARGTPMPWVHKGKVNTGRPCKMAWRRDALYVCIVSVHAYIYIYV